MVTEIRESSPLTAFIGGNGDSLSSFHVLPSLEIGWPPRPFQIVSLLEMLEFWAEPYYQVLYHLGLYKSEIAYKLQHRSNSFLERYISQEDYERFWQMANRIKFYSEPYDMEQTMRRIHNARIQAGRCTLEDIGHEIKELELAIHSDLFRSVFVYFPKDKAQYLSVHRNIVGEQGIFGERVGFRFPEASKEIAMAGDCYAIEAYTACVFHLGRAVEIAARVMVSVLKVKKELKGFKGQVIPVELATWEQLLSALQKGVDAKQANIGTSVRRKDTYEFYHQAMSQFRHFKDAWRNKMSHKRRTYQAGETKDIMDNVRQFMVHVAQRLSEPKRRP